MQVSSPILPLLYPDALMGLGDPISHPNVGNVTQQRACSLSVTYSVVCVLLGEDRRSGHREGPTNRSSPLLSFRPPFSLLSITRHHSSPFIAQHRKPVYLLPAPNS